MEANRGGQGSFRGPRKEFGSSEGPFLWEYTLSANTLMCGAFDEQILLCPFLMEVFLGKMTAKNMNPRLASAPRLIVYAFMQQCDDVETIYQSILNLPKKRGKRPCSSNGLISR